MAAASPNPHAVGADFIENSSLTYFIPTETKFSVEDTVQQNEGSHQALFEKLDRRESVFFDESVLVYLVFRTPYADADALRASLRRLVVSLEAHIVNGNAPDRDGPPASDVIYSDTVDDTDSAFIFSDPSSAKESSEHAERFSYAVWTLPVPLNRPRIRLQTPSVVFSATAGLKPADLTMSDELRDGYLQTGVAWGLNLLESLSNDPALNGIKPRLSARRVSRVAPLTQQTEGLLRPIASMPKFSLPIYPAIHTRIRFARPNTTPPSPAVIALLEVDFTPFFEHYITLDSLKLSFPFGGVVEDLTTQPDMALPLSCVAHDHVTYLFRLAPPESEADVASKLQASRDLSIEIKATALAQPGYCEPVLSMAWVTVVDFTLPLNSGFGGAVTPTSLQRGHRPSQLSIGGDTSFTSPAVSRPDSLPSFEPAGNRTESNVPDFGLTMTFSAPDVSTKIRPGQEFAWSVFVVNRSPIGSTISPRKLALVAIPKRRRDVPRVTRPPSISSHSHGPSNASKMLHKRVKSNVDSKAVASAVMDENVVYAMQRSSLVESADVVCLSADVRVGPLAPGACHVVELRFLALKAGIIGIEAVRVVDLASNEHVDIRELPTVLVEEGDS